MPRSRTPGYVVAASTSYEGPGQARAPRDWRRYGNEIRTEGWAATVAGCGPSDGHEKTGGHRTGSGSGADRGMRVRAGAGDGEAAGHGPWRGGEGARGRPA